MDVLVETKTEFVTYLEPQALVETDDHINS